MPDLSHRILAPELMDEAGGSDDTRAALLDLARVNRLSLGYRPTLAFIAAVARRHPGPLRIVDIGGGYGDMLRAIDRWATRRQVDLHLTSVDLNPHATAAGQAVPARQPLASVPACLSDYRPATPPDLVVSSLFAHHLDDPTLVRFLRWSEQTARLGWFVNDLHRHPLPYYFFRTSSRLLRLHRFVQHDGPVSFARAFSPADWRARLAEASIPDAQISWFFPFRLCVSRIK